MPTQSALWQKLYFDALYIEVARRVGYAGFDARDLANRCRTLLEHYSPQRLAAVFDALLSFTGNRVMLNPNIRAICSQLLGPPPEKWNEFYRHPDGTPTPRPTDRQTPADISEFRSDSIMDSVKPPITGHELCQRLEQAHHDCKRFGPKTQRGSVARDTIACVESELLRRGLNIPIPTQSPARTKKKRRPRKRT